MTEKELAKFEKEVIMQESFVNIPKSIKYPLNEIVQKFHSTYFLCTMNYQIALAMYLGYKELHLYGFNMIFNDDLIQRWSMEYWLGRAEQSGIKIVIPDDCDLLKCGALYGYEANNTLAVYIYKYMNELKKEVDWSISESIKSLQNAEKILKTLDGEQTKFTKEILNRHKINYEIREDELE